MPAPLAPELERPLTHRHPTSSSEHRLRRNSPSPHHIPALVPYQVMLKHIQRIPPLQTIRLCPPHSPSNAHTVFEIHFPIEATATPALASKGLQNAAQPRVWQGHGGLHTHPRCQEHPKGFPPCVFGPGAAGTICRSTGPPAACHRAWPTGRWGEQGPLRSSRSGSDKRDRMLRLFQGLAIFKSCFSCFPSRPSQGLAARQQVCTKTT